MASSRLTVTDNSIPRLVGWIGLGRMGTGMAFRVSRKFPLIAFDAKKNARENFRKMESYPMKVKDQYDKLMVNNSDSNLEVSEGSNNNNLLKTVSSVADLVRAGCTYFVCSLPTSKEVDLVADEIIAARQTVQTQSSSDKSSTTKSSSDKSESPKEITPILIDCSSGDYFTTIQIGEKLKRHGIHMIDCPVSGGPLGATQGTLASMIGGDDVDIGWQIGGDLDNSKSNTMNAKSGTNSLELPPLVVTSLNDPKETYVDGVKLSNSDEKLNLDNDYSVFSLICQFSPPQKINRAGKLGHGHAVKSVNNLLNATNLMMATESFCALTKAGIETETALRCINGSSGRSLMSEERIPEEVLSRKFDYGFAYGLMEKDCLQAEKLLLKGKSDSNDSHSDSSDFIPPHLQILRSAVKTYSNYSGSLDSDLKVYPDRETDDYTEICRVIEKKAGVELLKTKPGCEVGFTIKGKGATSGPGMNHESNLGETDKKPSSSNSNMSNSLNSQNQSYSCTSNSGAKFKSASAGDSNNASSSIAN